jgi:hypothetical protein
MRVGSIEAEPLNAVGKFDNGRDLLSLAFAESQNEWNKNV